MLKHHQPELAGNYNIGAENCITTGELADLFCRFWGNGASWEAVSQNNAPHEAGILMLDCTRIRKIFGWKPLISIEEAVKASADWGKAYLAQEDIREMTDNQIKNYLQVMNHV